VAFKGLIRGMDRACSFVAEGNRVLWMLADNCARLYNEVNYECRQAYIRYWKFGNSAGIQCYRLEAAHFYE